MIPEDFGFSESHPVMKALSAIFCLVLSQVASAETPPPLKSRFRDVVSHERLANALSQTSETDPMKALAPTTGADPSTVNQPVNLLEQSDIICFGDLATLVPKRAILSAPANIRDRLSLKPGVRFVGWSDFYATNRGWINTVEVSRVQAEGREPISEETQESIGKSTYLTIATFMGGPISVLPPKAPEEADKESVKP